MAPRAAASRWSPRCTRRRRRGWSRRSSSGPCPVDVHRGQRAHRRGLAARRPGGGSIRNGVDLDEWRPGPGGGPLVWFGRMVPEKGAAPGDRGRAPGRTCRCELVGPVSDRDYFAARVAAAARRRRRYLGHLAHDELADVVGRAAAALVTPRWDEPYGLVAAEALACGTPVCGFARGGPAGDRRRASAAVLVAPGRRRGPRRGASRQARAPDRAPPPARAPYAHCSPNGCSTATSSSTGRCDAARGVIGYYVHHVGRGHLHRARCDRRAPAPSRVTGLSSLPRPADWPGDVARAAARRRRRRPRRPHRRRRAALGAARDHAACATRMAAIAGWIARPRPSAFVSRRVGRGRRAGPADGRPGRHVALPGRRDDPAHQLGYELADAIIAPWPRLAARAVRRPRAGTRQGRATSAAFSRFDGRPPAPAPGRAAARASVRAAGGRRAEVTGRRLAGRRPRLPAGQWTCSAAPGSGSTTRGPSCAAATSSSPTAG